MNGLDFPAISPVIFSIGPVDVRWYSMAYLAGIVIGWILISRNVKKNNLGLSKENIEDLVFYLTLGIVLGGRLGYVLFYGGSSFWQNPLQIFEVWKGGMSFHGGVLGVIAAAWYFASKVNYKFLALTDLIVLYAPIGIFSGGWPTLSMTSCGAGLRMFRGRLSFRTAVIGRGILPSCMRRFWKALLCLRC